MSKLVIAEKPSVAMALAKVIGATSRKDGYMEGNGYVVSWCVGHLIGLCDAAEYDEKYRKWRYDDLPIFPDEWKHKVMEGTKKQFQILKKLMTGREMAIEEVICATDAGREGELIFRLVYEQAGCKKPIKRLWISSMEETSIAKGFQELKDGSCYDDLYQSALCRSKADWLVGINASRLFSVLYNQNLKVGRVQTPTLAMIVERNQKVQSFKKEKYYITYLKDRNMTAVSDHFATREEAEQVAADCNNRMCEVERDEKSDKTVRPPKLYDLTSLQRDANRIFGYTAQKTLDMAQALYEKKLLTYPRTDSQYLTDDMGESTRELIGRLMDLIPFLEDYRYEPNVASVLNSKKVSDHHAIIPTMQLQPLHLKGLDKSELNVLYLVCARLICATGESYQYVSHKSTLTCNYHNFYMKSIDVKQPGFKEVEDRFRAFTKGESEEDPEVSFMRIYLGQHFGFCKTEVAEKFTQPPKQFTEDTLLSAMERAGNEDLNEETEKKGLGTPATRAAIIEKLIRSGFVERDKKSLIPTEAGNVLITVLPQEIKSPKMTAEWELALTHIAQGKKDPESFLSEIESMLTELIKRYSGISEEERRRFPEHKPARTPNQNRKRKRN